ncbi:MULTISPECIES: DUF3995 domain-containing protein [Saccharothrix]|uniref:DUF3995 domain-containing protein n=1 Tax=Saccharothrix TaxID=2071 RepID=UPI00093F5478|nr:DUF3995 domain-containing protein [Saccharothrix sp. CB00851]OKI27053.1 hypothetical protein A6A25_07365 [Saccharothrix sp. CB00851]
MAVLALLTAGVLVLVGALHVVWIFSPWPLGSREEFARRVVDVPPERLPSPGPTLAVALALGLAAYLVVGRAELVGVPGPSWVSVVGTVGVAVVLLLRGGSGLVMSSRRSTEYSRLDLRVYSPLCLALATSCAVVAFGA